MKYAIIDIGSNSVRLMLWADGKTLYKKVKTTRLGEGLDGNGLLSETAVERTALAVEEFAVEGQSERAAVLAFATAAVRSAVNGGAFCQRIKKFCGIKVDVVSGEDEARLAVLGALGKRDGGIVDIGGASTEICLVEGGKSVFTRSIGIGAVRLHDACGQDTEKLARRIGAETADLPSAAGKKVFAVGGTASTLASLKCELSSYDPSILQDMPLDLSWVKKETDLLFSLPVGERRGLKGMDPARADILPGASLLLRTVMEKMGLNVVRFSDRDNLEGYLALKGLE